MSANTARLVLLFALYIGVTQSGPCPAVADFFCGSELDKTKWSDTAGVTTGQAKVEMAARSTGGVKLQGRRHLVSTAQYIATTESGVVVDGALQFDANLPQSQEFTICTRSDGEALIEGVTPSLLAPSPGIRSSTAKFFAQNGACLHLSSAENTATWRMTILFVGELAQYCQSSSTVDLDFNQDSGSWAFQLSDHGAVVSASVTLGEATDAPSWVEVGAGTCADAVITTFSGISSVEQCGALCDEDEGGACHMISHSSADASCALLGAPCNEAELSARDGALTYRRGSTFSAEARCSLPSEPATPHSLVSVFDGYQACSAAGTTTAVCASGNSPAVILTRLHVAQICSPTQPLLSWRRDPLSFPCPFSGFPVPPSGSLWPLLPLKLPAPQPPPASSLPPSLLLLLFDLPRAHSSAADLLSSLRLSASLSRPLPPAPSPLRCPRFPTPRVTPDSALALHLPLDANGPETSPSDPFAPASAAGDAASAWGLTIDPAGDPRGAVLFSGAAARVPFSGRWNPPNFTVVVWARPSPCSADPCVQQYLASSSSNYSRSEGAGWALVLTPRRSVALLYAVRAAGSVQWRAAEDRAGVAAEDGEWVQVVATVTRSEARLVVDGRRAAQDEIEEGAAFLPNSAHAGGAPLVVGAAVKGVPSAGGGQRRVLSHGGEDEADDLDGSGGNAELELEWAVEGGSAFMGAVAEVVVFGRALGSEEEAALWSAGAVSSNPTVATGDGTHVAAPLSLHALFRCPGGAAAAPLALRSSLVHSRDLLGAAPPPSPAALLGGAEGTLASADGGFADVRVTALRLPAHRVRSASGELHALLLRIPAPADGASASPLPLPALRFDSSPAEQIALLAQFPALGVAPGGVDGAWAALEVVVDGEVAGSKVTQLPAVAGDLSGTAAFKALQLALLLPDLPGGAHAASLRVRLLGHTLAGEALARGPWSLTAIRFTRGAAVSAAFSPSDAGPAASACSEAFDAPQSQRAGTQPRWSAFPAPLSVQLNVSSTFQAVLVIADLGRIQAEVVGIMNVRVVVRDAAGIDVSTAAMTAVPIFNGAACQAPTMHGVVELGPGRYSLSLEYWSPASPFAFRLCDMAPPQHRLIALTLPEAQLGLNAPTPMGAGMDDEERAENALPVDGSANLVRSCGCAMDEPCSTSIDGASDGQLAVDGDTSSTPGCAAIGGSAGARGVWMADLGSVRHVDAIVTVWLSSVADVAAVDGASVLVGMSETWSENAVCATLWSSLSGRDERAASVSAKCRGSGRFMFVVAPEGVALSVCEVETRSATPLVGAGFLQPPLAARGLSFDGNVFANPCQGSNAIDLGGSGLTISMWVRIAAADMLSGSTFLLDVAKDQDTSSSMFSYNIALMLKDGVVTYSLCDSASTTCTPEEVSATAPLEVDRWTHIAVVQQVSGSVALFQDGLNVAEATISQPSRHHRSACLVGKGLPAWAGQTAFVGDIQEVYVWDAALPESDLSLIRERVSLPNEGLVLSFASEASTSSPAASARFGGTACQQTSWSSVTEVGCVAAPGVGGALAAVLTLPGRGVVTRVAMFDYEKPRLEEQDAAALSGEVVTVRGAAFGIADFSASGRVGGTSCEMSAWFSDSSLECRVPSGVHTVGITVSVAGQARPAGQQQAVYAYEHPSVTALTPATASFESIASGRAEQITLFGKNFGQADFSAVGEVGATQCLSSQWVSDSAIVCGLRGGVGTGLSVRVAGAGSAAESCVAVRSCSNQGSAATCDVASDGAAALEGCGGDSTIQDAEGTCAAFGGRLCRRVELEASRASDQSPCDAAEGVFWSSTECCGEGGAAGRWVLFAGSEQQWQCRDAAAEAQVACCFVEEECWQAQGDLGLTEAFSYTAPQVAELEFSYEFARQIFVDKQYNAPPAAELARTSIWMVGSNFGSADFSGTPRVGGTACRQMTWTSDTILTCAVANGYWSGRDVTMEVMTQVGTLSEAFSYDEPVATDSLPGNLPPRPQNLSEPVAVLGKNFGMWDLSPRASVGGSACLFSQWVSDTSILCGAPAGLGSGKDIAVRTSPTQPHNESAADPAADSYHFGLELVLTFDAAAVSSVNRSNSPTSGGVLHAVAGSGFGTWDASPQLRVGGTMALSTAWTSDSAMAFRAPPGLFPDREVEVEVAGQRGTCPSDAAAACFLSYDLPFVSGIHGRSNAPAAGGAHVTVLGGNFGEWQHPAVALRVGDSQCQATTWQSGTSVLCRLPAGFTEGASVTLQLEASPAAPAPAAPSVLSRAFTYDGILPPPPRIDHLSDADGGNANGPAAGGSVITVIGAFLGPPALAPPPDMQIRSVAADQPRQCVHGFELVPVGSAACPFLEAQDLAWTGSVAAVELPSAAFPGTQCLETRWASESALLCTVPPGVGSALGVRVDAAWRRDPGTTLASVFSMREADGVNASQPRYVPGTFSYDGPALLPSGTVNETEMERRCDPADGGALCLMLDSAQPGSVPLIARLRGSNFGVFETSPQARTGFSSCESTLWESDSSTLCLAPSGVGSTLPVALSIADHRARVSLSDAAVDPPPRIGRREQAWGYDPVQVGLNGPVNAPQHNAPAAAVHGAGFGSADYSPRVQAGATLCLSSVWLADTSVACRPPPGIEAERSVTVVAFEHHPNTSSPQHVFAAIERSAADGTMLYRAHQDAYFLSDRPWIHAVFGYTAECLPRDDRIQSSTPVAPMTTPADTVSNGTNSSAPVNRRLLDLESGSHEPEANLSCLVLKGRATAPGRGGEVLTLTGGGFGTWDTSVGVRLGYTACESSSWVSDSAALCRTPRGSHNDSAFLPVAITVARSESDAFGKFQYEDVGAVRLELDGDTWIEEEGATDVMEVIEGQTMPLWQQPRVRLDDAFNRTATLAQSLVTATLVGGAGAVEMTGTAVLQAIGGFVAFTDLGVTGVARNLRLRISSSENLGLLHTRPFDARRGECVRALQSVSVTAGIDTGGVPLRVNLGAFRNVQPELVRVFFSAHYPESPTPPHTLHVPVAAEVSQNVQFDELVVAVQTPNWGTETPRLVNVSLDLTGSSLAPTAQPCFEFFMIESDVIFIASMAPRVCSVFTNFGLPSTINLILHDPTNKAPFPDAWDGVSALVGEGNEQGTAAFEASAELSEPVFSKLGSFSCPPMPAPGVYKVSLVNAGGLICCEHPRYEPDGGFQLEYVPPPAVIAPTEVFEIGAPAQITLYFPARFLPAAAQTDPGPAAASAWANCVLFFGEYTLDRMESGFAALSLASASGSGDQVVLSFMTPNVTESSLPEGPSVLPVRIQCACADYSAHECGPAAEATPTGVKLTIRRLPKLRGLDPDSVFVTGGKTVLRISSPAFPLPADSLMVTASFRLESGELAIEEQQTRAELVTINPKLANVQVTLPTTPQYLEGTFHITVTPLGQSDLMVVKATIPAVAPAPEVMELNPATMTTNGGAVSATVAFIRGSTDAASLAVKIGSEDISVTEIEYSDFLESRLSFAAPPSAPGSKPFTVLGTVEPDRVAGGFLLIQAPQVTVSCTGFTPSGQSEPVDPSTDSEGLCIAPAGPPPSTAELPPRPALGILFLSVAGSPNKQVRAPAFKIQGEEVAVETEAGSNGRTLRLLVPAASLGIRLNAPQPPVRATAVAEGTLQLVDSAGSTEEVDFVVRFAYLFAPEMAEVRFGSTGTYLTIAWSQPTDAAGLALGEEFPCTQLFEAVGRGGAPRTLGIAPTCSFETPALLRLLLGENPRGEPDRRVEPGDYLRVRQRNATAGGGRELLSVRSIDGWSERAAGDGEILVPTAAQPATVWLDAPSVVPNCASDPLTITAVVTSTRDVSIVWGSDDEDLDAVLATVSGLAAELRPTDLVVGRLYSIYADVTDFLQSATPRVTTQLEVTAGLIPVVKIEATGPFYRSQASLVFGAITKFSSCETDKSKLVFDWKIFPPSAQTQRRRSFLERRSDAEPLWVGSEQAFEVPTAVLTAAEAQTGPGVFEVTLTAGGDGKLQSSASLQLEFDQQQLVVGFRGGDRVHVVSDTLVVDASPSHDPDMCPEGCEEASLPGCAAAGWMFREEPVALCDDPDLVVSWACTVATADGRPCRAGDKSRLELPSAARIEVDTSDLDGEPDVLYFTVTVSKGNRASSAGLRIGLQRLVAFEIDILPLVPQPSWDARGVFQVVDFEDFKASTRLSNASVDYLATRSDATLFYAWQMYDADQAQLEPLPADNSNIAPLGRLGALFALNKFVLQLRRNYLLEVRVSAETSAGTEVAAGVARMAVVVNGPPEGGYCTVEPSEGIGLKTLFRFQCFKWNDVEVPLKYVFGYRSLDESVVSEGEAAVKPDKELRLPAGEWQAVMFVQDDLGSRTLPQVVDVAVAEDAAEDGNREAEVQSQMDELDQLGDAAATTQAADAAAAEANEGPAARRGGRRSLLASSAAYRMRVRRLMLRKMSGNPGAANARSAAAQMQSQAKLSSQPTEVVPATGADADGSDGEAVLAASIAAIEVQGASLPVREVLRQAGANVIETCDQIVAATAFLPPVRRSQILIKAARALFVLRDKMASQVLVGEAPKPFTARANLALALQRTAVPRDGRLVVGNPTLLGRSLFPGGTDGSAAEDSAASTLQIALLDDAPPPAAALTDVDGLLSTVAFAVEVPQSALDATDGEVMVAPAAFKHAWNILGTPQEVLGRVIGSVAELSISDSRAAAEPSRRRRRALAAAERRDERDIEFRVGGREMAFGVAFDVSSSTSTFNASETDYYRRKANIAVKCLRWNQIEWDTASCNATNITTATVRCDCRHDGAVVVVYKYVDDSREERFAVHAFPLAYTCSWEALLYLMCAGIGLALVVWLLEMIFSAHIQRISLLYRHDMEYYVPAVRGYQKLAVGWFGSNKGPRTENFHGWVQISSFLHVDDPGEGEKHSWRTKYMVVAEGSAQYYISDKTNVHTRVGCLRLEGSELLLFEEAEQWMNARGWEKANRPEWTRTTFILLGEAAAAETMVDDARPRAIKKLSTLGSFRHRVHGSFKDTLAVVPTQVETPSVLICHAHNERELACWVDAVVCSKARARVGGIQEVHLEEEWDGEHAGAGLSAEQLQQAKYEMQDSAEWGLDGKWMKLLAECKFMDQRRTTASRHMDLRRSGLLSEEMFRLALANALEPDSTEETWQERGDMLLAAEAYVRDADRNRAGDVRYVDFIRRRTGHAITDFSQAAAAADAENGIAPESPVAAEELEPLARTGSGQSLMSKMNPGARVAAVHSSFVGAGDGALVLERASPTPYISQAPAPSILQPQASPGDSWPLLREPTGILPILSSPEAPAPPPPPAISQAPSAQVAREPSADAPHDDATPLVHMDRTQSHATGTSAGGAHSLRARRAPAHGSLAANLQHAVHDSRTHWLHARRHMPTSPKSGQRPTLTPRAESQRKPPQPGCVPGDPSGGAEPPAAAAPAAPSAPPLVAQTEAAPPGLPPSTAPPAGDPTLPPPPPQPPLAPPTPPLIPPTPPPRGSRAPSEISGQASARQPAAIALPRLPAASAPSWAGESLSGTGSGSGLRDEEGLLLRPQVQRAGAPPEHGPWHDGVARSPQPRPGEDGGMGETGEGSAAPELVPARQAGRVGLSSQWVQARGALGAGIEEEPEVGDA